MTKPGAEPESWITAARAQNAQLGHFLMCVGLPHLMVASGPVLLPEGWLSWFGVVLFMTMWTFVGGFGVSVGFHRHFAHRAFAAHRMLRYAMGIAGSMAAQGPLIYWVALHRSHHSLSDRPGDPHSPHPTASGRKGRLAAFVYAHALWAARHNVPKPSRYAAELAADPVARFLNRHYRSFVLLGVLLPAAIAGVYFQSWNGCLIGAYWGGVVRITFGHHVIWSVNSFCHYFGRHPHATPDCSTNNWVISIPAFGEGWHNNHHNSPSSPKFGNHWDQVDIGWWMIRCMQMLKLANSTISGRFPESAYCHRRSSTLRH